MQSIRELRESAGLSRQSFCDTFQIPFRTVTSWENGERKPPEYVVRMIDIILGNLYEQ